MKTNNKPRIFVTPCPFNKHGAPVVGSFGSRIQNVVIITVETWNRLCAENPQLASTQFEVGAPE